MSRAFAASLSDVSQSPDPVAVVIAAAAALAVAALVVALFRARRTFAAGAVVAIVLLAAGLAATILGSGSSSQRSVSASAPMDVSALPALSCLDELAGEVVAVACERAVFSSAETTAAAVSYTAAQMSRLASHGNAAAADRVMTPSLQALRRAVERDRFGMVAHVLATRDACTLSKCAFFASLTNTARIANNMSGHAYDAFVALHAPAWGQASVPLSAALAPNEPERPTGKPVSGDFPSSASIPPISIMAPEPATASVPAKPAEGAHPPQQPRAAAKKPAPSHPRPLTPPAATTPSAPAAPIPATVDSR